MRRDSRETRQPDRNHAGPGHEAMQFRHSCAPIRTACDISFGGVKLPNGKDRALTICEGSTRVLKRRIDGRTRTAASLLGCALVVATTLASAGAPLRAQTADAAVPITFADILAAPDDLSLNLRYARQEIREGRLQQAASALERMLLNEPDWDSARLVYGIVLYRLRDMDGAAREFEKLDGRPLSPSEERDRRRYLDLATEADDPLTIQSRISAGLRVDSNPARVADDPLFRSIGQSEDADAGITASTHTRAELSLQTGRGDYLFLEANGFLNDFFGSSSGDIAVSRARAGATLFGTRVSVTPFASIGTGYQNYERFLLEGGGGVDLAFELTPRFRLFGGGAASYQDYEGTDFSRVGDLRDGWLYSGHAGARVLFSDANILTLTGRYFEKDARGAGFSYDRAEIEVNHLSLFERGVYLNANLRAAAVDYDAPDPRFRLAARRDDEDYRARLAVGAPLETLFSGLDRELPEAIGSIVLQVAATYDVQRSNIPQLDVKNLSGDVMLTKRFQF